jgi:hypothetical protein
VVIFIAAASIANAEDSLVAVNVHAVDPDIIDLLNDILHSRRLSL